MRSVVCTAMWLAALCAYVLCGVCRNVAALCEYVLWRVQKCGWLLCVDTFCGVYRTVAGCFVWIRSVSEQEV